MLLLRQPRNDRDMAEGAPQHGRVHDPLLQIIAQNVRRNEAEGGVFPNNLQDWR